MKTNEQYVQKAIKERIKWAKNDAIRDTGVKDPNHLKKITDIVYSKAETEEEKKWHLIDIYYPTET